jgi:hypothetical protein
VPKSTSKPPKLTPSQLKLQQQCTCDDDASVCSETCGLPGEGDGGPANQLHLQVHIHHQPINVLTTEHRLYGSHIRRTGQSPPRERSADWWVLTTANAAGTNGLKCLPKQGARDNKFMVTHPKTDQCCLASAIVCRVH